MPRNVVHFNHIVTNSLTLGLTASASRGLVESFIVVQINLNNISLATETAGILVRCDNKH
jgi:hypothetical protein